MGKYLRKQMKRLAARQDSCIQSRNELRKRLSGANVEKSFRMPGSMKRKK